MKDIIEHIKNYRLNRNIVPTIGLNGIYDSWEAAYERDGYVFEELHYNYPVIPFMIQKYLEDDNLKFFYDIDEVKYCNFVLMGSAL